MAANTDLPLEAFPGSSTTGLTDTISLREALEHHDASAAPSVELSQPGMSHWRITLTIATLSGLTTVSSMTTGLLVVALPRMALDLHLPDDLLLWPASIYGLTSGCSLLIAGSIADVVGSRIVYLVGCFALSLFVLGSGLSTTSTQLIVCRGGQGVAVSMCLPTAMSLLTLYLPVGKRRNIGFAFVGAGQPLGFALGLFLGGFFVDSIGWRYAWYMSAGVAMAVLVAGLFGLPKYAADGKQSGRRKTIAKEIDWIGAILSSACLGMLSYVLAIVANDGSSIKHPTQIVLLCVSFLCLCLFIYWMDFQTNRGRPALIPNYFWKQLAFSSICFIVFLTWAIVQTLSYFFSLYFQKVQNLSAIQTSLRFTPDVLLGIVLSVATGMILHRASAYWIALSSLVLTSISPLLMALNDPSWPFWYATFWAITLSQISADILFVISALIITSTFPTGTQALASAVFNTISQFGTAVGLAIMGVISSTVTQKYAKSHDADSHFDNEMYSPMALLTGYRASYWACFAISILACSVAGFGLRGVGNKGMKQL